MNREEIYRNILENMDEGVLSIDLNGNIITFNPASEKILGLKADYVLGKKFAEAFIPLKNADEFNQVIIDTIITSKKIYNKSVKIIVGNEEKVLNVTTSFLFNNNNEKIGVIVVFSDITEIEKLKISEQKLHKQLEEEHKKLQKSYLELEEKTESLRQMTQKLNKLKFVGVLLIFGFFSFIVYKVIKNTIPSEKYFSSKTEITSTKSVSYAKTTLRTIIKTIGFVGSISPLTTINIVAPFEGEIKKIYVSYGESVKKGEVLCSIDPSDLIVKIRKAEIQYIKQKNEYKKLLNWKNSPQVSAARRQLDAALKDYQDAKNNLAIAQVLYKKGIIPRTELEAAIRNVEMTRNSYESAKDNLRNVLNVANKDNLKIAKIQLDILKNNLDSLKNSLKKQNIISPINGILLPAISSDGKKVVLNKGKNVSKGDMLFSIGDLTGFSIKIGVSESDITKLKIGMDVKVYIDAIGNKILHGKISSIALVPSNSQDKSSVPLYSVVIKINKIPTEIRGKILLGMSARADIILYKNTSAITVPVDCVGEDNQGFYVLKLVNNKVVKTRVSIGYVGDSWVEIKEGLKLGDKVERL